MRYHEICESIDDYLPRVKAFLEHWPVIRQQCSDILRLYRGRNARVLLRGVRDHSEPIFKTTSIDRPPEANERREEADRWLIDHGFKALRGNSVFCSNSLTQMFVYGEPYIILPCDGFQYTWYRDAADLYQLNFNTTLTRKDLSIDDLMKLAVPARTDIEDMLQSNRDHELHFIGPYWALNRRMFGQIFMDAKSNGRYIIPKWKAALKNRVQPPERRG